MRIAGNTLRRNYLNNYHKSSKRKFESEQKIETNRQYVRASQSPIKAAKALRVRKSISEMETYQTNLKSADSIYTMAESSMSGISGQIQLVYEKLVEGAHGTRNQDDMNIIATDIEEKAKQMVQLLNVEVAGRKLFGGTNNETNAFAIEGYSDTQKYITYNGVAINSSSDPELFPFSGTSYLDIGIGMKVNVDDNRIDDQTGLPITFNGALCTGCGISQRTVTIDLESIKPGEPYKLDVTLSGEIKQIEFNGGDTVDATIENINKAFSDAFQLTPEVDAGGNILYLDNMTDYPEPLVYQYDDADITDNAIDLKAMNGNHYYSLQVSSNGKTRIIDFKGDDDINVTLDNIRKELEDKFGNDAPEIYSNGYFRDKNGIAAEVENTSDYGTPLSYSGTKFDLASIKNGVSYSMNINDTKVTFEGGATQQETIDNINEAFSSGLSFGKANVPFIANSTGIINYDSTNGDVMYADNADDVDNEASITAQGGYSKNIMQLVLDAAQALRDGDQQLVARYADLLYEAQSNLSVAIAELGTNEQFIEFNQTRIDNSTLNLDDRQNDLEFTDLASEITNYKVLESIHNATLQMGAQLIPQSIFNYIS